MFFNFFFNHSDSPDLWPNFTVAVHYSTVCLDAVSKMKAAKKNHIFVENKSELKQFPLSRCSSNLVAFFRSVYPEFQSFHSLLKETQPVDYLNPQNTDTLSSS